MSAEPGPMAADWITGPITEVSRASPLHRDDEKRTPAMIVISGASAGEVFALPPGTSLLGRAPDARVSLHDQGVSRQHAQVSVIEGHVSLEDLESRNGTFVNGLGVEESLPLADGDRIQLGHGTILKFTYLDSLEDAFQRELHGAVMRDGVTKLFNRRYFLERVTAELRFAGRHGTSIGVLLLDIDRFKRVNDVHGHAMGHRVLAALGATLARELRAEDVVARWGGQEFVVLLRAVPVSHVRVAAERVCQVVRDLRVESAKGVPIRTTVSIGVASYPNPTIGSAEELVEAAARSMRTAKLAGRDRVGD